MKKFELTIFLLKMFLERESWKCINKDERSGVYAFKRFDFKEYKIFAYTDSCEQRINKIILYFGPQKLQTFNFIKFETITDIVSDIEERMSRGFFDFEIFYNMEM